MPDMTKEVLFEITNRTVYPFDDEYVDIVVEADNDSRRINFSVCKYFDGVDLAFMVHTTSGDSFAVNTGNVGCVAKKIIY